MITRKRWFSLAVLAAFSTLPASATGISAGPVSGRLMDEAPNRPTVGTHPLASVVMNFYAGVPRHGGYERGRRVAHVVTDREGRFSLPQLRRGWYIETLSSADVATEEGLLYFNPTHRYLEIHACSRKFDGCRNVAFPQP